MNPRNSLAYFQTKLLDFSTMAWESNTIRRNYSQVHPPQPWMQRRIRPTAAGDLTPQNVVTTIYPDSLVTSDPGSVSMRIISLLAIPKLVRGGFSLLVSPIAKEVPFCRHHIPEFLTQTSRFDQSYHDSRQKTWRINIHPTDHHINRFYVGSNHRIKHITNTPPSYR
jgi:hypothetical protein